MTNGEHDLRHGQNPEENATEILARENLLLSLGFSQDWINKLKVDNPTLCSEEIINSKIQGLTKRGFSNPKKMIESLPAILSYAFENIDDKLAGLTERGFSNPKKMIESLPAILGLAFENIDDKLAGLTERGFSNPKKMIESLPTILGLAFENIDRKLKMLEKIIKLYDLTLSAPELMEQIPFLFSSKIDKLWTIARICKKYLTQPSDIDAKLIQKMLSFNLEDVMLALQTTPSPTNMDELTEKEKTNPRKRDRD